MKLRNKELKLHQEKFGAQLQEAKSQLQQFGARARKKKAQVELEAGGAFKRAKRQFAEKGLGLRKSGLPKAAHLKAEIAADIANFSASVEHLATELKDRANQIRRK